MVGMAQEIAPGRFRESYGRYYEDFEVGHVYEHRPGRTITEADNVWFTLPMRRHVARAWRRPARHEGHPDMAAPLEDIRVLDFRTLLPDPMATLLLAEAGAEVIKI